LTCSLLTSGRAISCGPTLFTSRRNHSSTLIHHDGCLLNVVIIGVAQIPVLTFLFRGHPTSRPDRNSYLNWR
jgi:hypothetical protein